MNPISKNFTLEEMISSATATERRIDNTPSEEVKENIQRLVDNALQPIRDMYGKPITVNSGYRSPELNKAVNGAKNSQHLTGCAADITVGSKASNKELFGLILKRDIPFDQLIDESGYAWLHISYKESDNRMQVLHLK